MAVARKVLKSKSVRPEHLEEAYVHLLAREHNTDSLARALGVSFATSTRVVEKLRAKLAAEGDALVSVKTLKGWHYEIREKIDWKNDPLIKAVGVVKGAGRRWKSAEDESIYGRD